MIIKGHPTIKLIDDNGNVEIYEGDNMLTNALSYYFQDVGAFNASPIHTPDVRNNLIPKLLGGLLLLDTALTENAENIICPSGVEMVGNGAYNVTSDGQDGVTELGSYNATESGWKYDGHFKLVWDFAKSQANGKDANQKIASVCLTSAAHGYIGEGNATSNVMKTATRSDFEATGTAAAIDIDGEEIQSTRIVHASRTSDTYTMIDYTNIYRVTGHENEHMSETGKVLLKQYYAPIKEIDMRFGSGQDYIPKTTIEVAIPSGFKTALNHNQPMVWGKAGDTFYMATGFSGVDYGGGNVVRWPANSTAHILRINADNTVSYFTPSNPSDHAIDFYISSMIVAGTTLFFTEYNVTGTWFMDLVTVANIDYVQGKGVPYYNFVYPTQGVAQANGAKIDIANHKIYWNNSYRASGLTGKGKTMLSDNLLTNGFEGVTHGTAIYKSTNYLATIYNLQEPIKKTADKAMQVIYDVYFDDGE